MATVCSRDLALRPFPRQIALKPTDLPPPRYISAVVVGRRCQTYSLWRPAGRRSEPSVSLMVPRACCGRVVDGETEGCCELFGGDPCHHHPPGAIFRGGLSPCRVDFGKNMAISCVFSHFCLVSNHSTSLRNGWRSIPK